MEVRRSTYEPLGYTINYETREKYRGFTGAHVRLCHAAKDGKEYFALPDEGGRLPKIMKLQNLIPHMAHYSEPANGHILIEVAPGKLIWDWNPVSDIAAIEKQLLEFVEGANANGLSHRDVRPWNVFLDDNSKITVIDWGSSEFNKNDFDLKTAKNFVRLLKGEIEFQDAWGGLVTWYPPWCRHR